MRCGGVDFEINWDGGGVKISPEVLQLRFQPHLFTHSPEGECNITVTNFHLTSDFSVSFQLLTVIAPHVEGNRT